MLNLVSDTTGERMPQQLTHDEVRRIAKEIAYAIGPEIIDQAFIRLGFDIEEPTEIQQDMAYLRKLRNNATNMRMQIINGMILIMTGAGVVTLAQNIKAIVVGFLNNIHS